METTLFCKHALLPEGWGENVRIIADDIGQIKAVMADASPSEHEHLTDIVVPGMANLHCHGFQRAMAGLAERAGPGSDNFWTWRETMYQIAGRIDPKALYAIAAMAYMEMLESGFTAVGEFHYLHHQPDGTPYDNLAEMSAQVIEAARRSGIAQTLLPVFYNRGGFNNQPLSARQKRFGNSLDGYEKLIFAIKTQFPDIQLGVAPHSLRALNTEQLSALIAAFPDCPVQIHIAEQMREVEECREYLGASPVRWLLDHNNVDERWCLVHATHMDMQETEDLARSGAVAGLCPITEANLGDGLFPASPYFAQNGRFGIGSDSCVRIDLAEELRLFDYGQRLTGQCRTPLAKADQSSGRTLFNLALSGGAQALGQNTGAIRTGMQADFVTLDMNHPALISRSGDAWLDGWIYAAPTNPVCDVFVAGKQVVKNGYHIHRKNIEADFQHTLKAMLQ